jgi:hypothetical protein
MAPSLILGTKCARSSIFTLEGDSDTSRAFWEDETPLCFWGVVVVNRFLYHFLDDFDSICSLSFPMVSNEMLHAHDLLNSASLFFKQDFNSGATAETCFLQKPSLVAAYPAWWPGPVS